MKILVIGNGFDLDHKLPTSYKNFLDFCIFILNKQINSNEELETKLTDKQLEFYNKLCSEKILNSFVELILNNNLVTYLIEKSTGVDWIDFESEIKNIVDIFSSFESEYQTQKVNRYSLEQNHIFYKMCNQLSLNFFHRTSINGITVDENCLTLIHNNLNKFLEKLTKALELYISEFINKEKPNTFSPDIIEFNPNRVISFNYSDTFERLYPATSNAKNVDYIHGKADNIIGSDTDSNIVLGITSDQTVKSNYVTIEKYYQRITKRTGAKYKEWLKNDNDRIDIMFFGHSLDSADTDILLDLIEHKKSFVKILYHNNTSYKTIIENLNRVLGKEKLINYVYGNQPKIEFKKQQKACNKGSKGWEITHDIADIKNLHLLSNADIEKLINKIESKIGQKDIDYFYNQKSIISLYDALTKHKLEKILPTETLSVIVQELDFEKNNGKLIEYDIESWTTINQFNEKEYSHSTKKLLYAINTLNKVRFQYWSKQSLVALIGQLEIKENSDAETSSILYKVITNPLLFKIMRI